MNENDDDDEEEEDEDPPPPAASKDGLEVEKEWETFRQQQQHKLNKIQIAVLPLEWNLRLDRHNNKTMVND